MSKQFLEISRDDELWKNLCFQGSPISSKGLINRDGRYGGPIPIQEPSVFTLQRAVLRTTGSSSSSDDNDAGTPSNLLASATKRPINWDLSDSGEQVDWHNEYIARHAPLSMSWLSPAPSTPGGFMSSEVRGMGLLKKDGNDILITPMGDGSVCLWHFTHNNDRPMPPAGQVTSRSNCGILLGYNRKEPTSSYIPSSNAVECVSVDQSSGKAYFAAQSMLTEVDLTTLQASGQKIFPNPICSLSEGGAHPNPLTVGTTESVHVYDPRDSSPRTSSHTCLAEGLTSIDPPQVNGFLDFERLYSGDRSHSDDTSFASIEPLPLSIVHLSHDIHVGGRFPSILTYDRRYFPRKMTSIYSGARISALSSLHSQDDSKRTLVAAGEYKGKGSLELYPLYSDSASQSLPSAELIKNRASASRSKLLSIIPHGTRLLFSDLDGQLKWVERDGSTLVRRWNINSWSVHSSAEARVSLFNAGTEEGDVARKLLAVDEGERSEVLVWTGEKIGVMGYGDKSRFAKGTKEDERDGNGDEGTSSGDEEKYGRMMRRALERQADEVRFVRGLGLGG